MSRSAKPYRHDTIAREAYDGQWRTSPEVGAGWFNDHVRICAGGAQQCAFLPQLRGGAGQPASLPR